MNFSLRFTDFLEQRKIFLLLVVISMLKIDEPFREFWQFLLIFCPLDPEAIY